MTYLTSSSNSVPSAVLLLAVIALFLVGRWVYRLTLHPLAKFPGPKMAAMTSTVAMYYDLPMSTSYIKQFPRWHDKYGPIVRIEPNHLHIRDMDAYNQVFKIGTKFNRDPALYSFPFTRGSFFNKLSVREAKPHRDMYSHSFSRGAVQSLEPVIRDNLTKFLTKVDEAAQASKAVDLSLAYRCLTADTILRYCYDKSFGALDSPGFRCEMIMDIEKFFEVSTFAWYLPNLLNRIVSLVATLPRKWIQFNRPLAVSLHILDTNKDRLVELKAEDKNKTTPNVFRTALDPNVEKGQPVLSMDELAADALVFFTAGTDTTAHALVTGTWHLLQNKPMLERLQRELVAAIPDPALTRMELDWAALEKLDYLRSVVKESIRLSYGAPGKLPRQVPPEGVTFCGQHVPGGTMVSMCSYVYHNHEEYFEEASTYKPERWLDPDLAVDVERNFVSFSRGSRGCIGINLAYAEAFYAFAYMFRYFEMGIFDTTTADMEWHDAFVAATYGHLQVKLRRLDQDKFR